MHWLGRSHPPVHCAPLERRTKVRHEVYKRLAPTGTRTCFGCAQEVAARRIRSVTAMPPDVRKAYGFPVNWGMNSAAEVQ